jgi:hypothetical protein
LKPRVDKLSIDDDIEYASSSADKVSLDSEFFLDFCRQTGGLRFVISSNAVVNLDFHFTSPPPSVSVL